MIDTHTHLQFKAFEGKVDRAIKSAQDVGVEKIVVVGTDLETSRKAAELAKKHTGLYASVGIHPHHVFSYCHPALDAGSRKSTWIPAFAGMTKESIHQLEQLINHPKVVAIGETGLDRHVYKSTQYLDYKISDAFIKLQKVFFEEQIKLAIKHQKSLIIHNREAVSELLEVLEANWDPFLEGRSVFHCCEPDHRSLDFAKAHQVFIGVDGDVTYDKAKQEFVKEIPLELLVLETDSPYFMPEPLRHPALDAGSRNNEPKNLKIISEFVANLKDLKLQNLENATFRSSEQLFAL